MYETWDAHSYREATYPYVLWQRVKWSLLCDVCHLTKYEHDTCLCMGMHTCVMSANLNIGWRYDLQGFQNVAYVVA